MNILIIEDESALARALTALLMQNGYVVDAVDDGVEGEDAAMSGIYELIILDVMLPGRNGFDVARNLRGAGCSTPILMLTAKAETVDKIEGLDRGADDYLTKPFSTGELLARVRAMTRRKGEYIGSEIVLAGTVLNLDTHEIVSGGNRIKLSLKEFQILEMLMTNSRQIVDKDRIIQKVWGYDSDAEYNTVEVYISFIRKKLKAIRSGVAIQPVRGVGYMLEAPHD